MVMRSISRINPSIEAQYTGSGAGESEYSTMYGFAPFLLMSPTHCSPQQEILSRTVYLEAHERTSTGHNEDIV